MKALGVIGVAILSAVTAISAQATAIYAINDAGDMFFYTHTGAANGTATFPIQAKQIGTAWHFRQVFAGEHGAIYAVKPNGDMLFYKFAGEADGSANGRSKRKRSELAGISGKSSPANTARSMPPEPMARCSSTSSREWRTGQPTGQSRPSKSEPAGITGRFSPVVRPTTRAAFTARGRSRSRPRADA